MAEFSYGLVSKFEKGRRGCTQIIAHTSTSTLLLHKFVVLLMVEKCVCMMAGNGELVQRVTED